MKNNETRFLFLFAMVAVIIFGAAVFLRGRLAIAPAAGRAGVGAGNSEAVGAQTQAPVPDSIAIASSSIESGDEVVANATAGYYFSMPTNWYVEKSAGAGLAVYPDYDPKKGETPGCKIEVSTFLNNTDLGANGLNAWITGELHTDPTASVTEISRAQVSIGDGNSDSAGATSSAIEWSGVVNGATTTLVYAVEPGSRGSNSGNILEIAPSTLSEASDADNDDCDLDLQAFIANLQFGAYEP